MVILLQNLRIDEINDIHKNIASSAQKVFERKLIEICDEMKRMIPTLIQKLKERPNP